MRGVEGAAPYRKTEASVILRRAGACSRRIVKIKPHGTGECKKDIRLDVLLGDFLCDQFSLDIMQGGFDGFLFILCVFVKLAERTAILV